MGFETKIEGIPEDLDKLGKTFQEDKNKFEELSGKAETMIAKIESTAVQPDKFNKVKTQGEGNTNRIDKIQRQDKMLNLLITNLPSDVHNLTGFSNFAYHVLNVELSPGDIMYLYKVFESTSRVVHLVHFRSLEVRNAVCRGRTNLGYRSRVWVNEDLVPTKDNVALGARRQFRAGKIARNWTFQGDVYIALKEDPRPIKMLKEEDFPESTKLQGGEEMLPKEMPMRRQRQNFNPYIQGNIDPRPMYPQNRAQFNRRPGTSNPQEAGSREEGPGMQQTNSRQPTPTYNQGQMTNQVQGNQQNQMDLSNQSPQHDPNRAGQPGQSAPNYYANQAQW